MATFSSNNNVDVLVKTTADTEGVDKTKKSLGELDDASKKSHDISASLAQGGQQASLLMAGGFAAVTLAGTDMLHSFEESQNANAQLSAVLESTHGVSGLTLKDLNAQSAALQKLTMFSDEQIGSAQGLLLTFTDLKGPVVKQATQTVLDMSQALGQDLKSSSIQLGKALQDPILGISALRRVGVNFSEDQKKVIEQLVNTGQKAKAQQLIMKELNTEFGGSAAAAGKTAAGQIAILGNQMDEAKEAIGGLIAEGIAPLVAWATKLAESIDWTALMERVRSTVIKFTSAFMDFTKPIREFVEKHRAPILMFLKDFAIAMAIVIPLWAAFTAISAILASPLFLVVAAVAALIFVWDKWHVQIIGLWNTVRAFAVSIWQSISAAFTAIGNGIEWLKGHWAEAIGFIIGFAFTLPFKILGAFTAAMVGVWNYLASLNWKGIFGAVGKAWGDMWGGALAAVQNVWNWVSTRNWGSILLGVGKSIANSIIDLVQGAINGAFAGIPGHPKVNLPHFSTGVRNFSGGLAVVGDVNGQGGEIVSLPAGSDVYSNSDSKKMLGGNKTDITIGSVYLGDASAVDRFFTRLGRNTELAQKGLATYGGN